MEAAPGLVFIEIIQNNYPVLKNNEQNIQFEKTPLSEGNTCYTIIINETF